MRVDLVESALGVTAWGCQLPVLATQVSPPELAGVSGRARCSLDTRTDLLPRGDLQEEQYMAIFVIYSRICQASLEHCHGNRACREQACR